ncbi:hypothetical protein HBI13_099710 [Parastagonospora nodorum]|nr:hypothetical protein HBI10_109470 [Parastagonospora nodorum]KAH4022221.1 hypothetical protein HBI13_099710 [Parastagonospora nodorum]
MELFQVLFVLLRKQRREMSNDLRATKSDNRPYPNGLGCNWVSCRLNAVSELNQTVPPNRTPTPSHYAIEIKRK